MGILTQSQKSLFDSNIFDRAIRSAHPVEIVDFFNGMRGSDCSLKKVFEAHRISHHPRIHTITLYDSSDASLAVAVLLLLLLLLTTTRRGTSCSPPASSACTVIRWQQCVLSITFFLQHRCCSCCCCSALFGDSRRSPTPQPRR